MATAVHPPPAKKQKLAYHHKHQIQYKPPVTPGEAALLPQELLDKLIIQSIKAICEEQAHKSGISEPFIDSVALEALRSGVDEFVHNVCAKVHRSMIAARRTAPIAPDFDAAFYALDVPVPYDQLQPYSTKVDINPPLLPTPPPEDEFHVRYDLPEDLLGPQLSRQEDLKRFSFNTASLPPVPSAHTYRDTEVYQKRETDSKKIRERATEEGKLGEQALRKLAGAVKLEAALSTEPETRYLRDQRPRRLRRKPVLTEEAMFEDTMRDLLISEKGDFELGPVVSAEKQYRMPDEGRVKRRPVATSAPTRPAKYNVLPPPRTKSKPANSNPVALFEL